MQFSILFSSLQLCVFFYLFKYSLFLCIQTNLQSYHITTMFLCGVSMFSLCLRDCKSPPRSPMLKMYGCLYRQCQWSVHVISVSCQSQRSLLVVVASGRCLWSVHVVSASGWSQLSVVSGRYMWSKPVVGASSW